LSDPRTLRDGKLLASLGREHQRLLQVVALSNRLARSDEELLQARELLNVEDPELAAEARAEVDRLEASIVEMEEQSKPLLIPQDPLNERSCIFGEMHFESGVHRVQRVPETEAQGRIHTSAATVAVLPEAEEVDVEIDDKDLRIDVYRASGPGGQGVNTTDSAVRITHLPTGIVVTQQDQRSQLQNKAQAMKVLRAKILDGRLQALQADRARLRKSQVSTGDRSAKIRTYNFPQSRVTDHRINLTLHDLPRIMDGDIGKLIEAMKLADTEERLREEG